MNPCAPCPTATCPRDESLSGPLQCRYLDGLRGRRPLLGAASGHVQEERLESAWQGQLAVSRDTELGGRPQDCSHTVYGGLGGQRGGPGAQNCPQAGGVLRAWRPHHRPQAAGQALAWGSDQYPQASEPQREQEDLGPSHTFQLALHEGKVALRGPEAQSSLKPYRAAKR